MASRGLRKLAPGRFQVDFSRLLQSGCVLGRWLRPATVEVDPFTLGKAVQQVLERCEVRSVRGKPLVWNELKIFLAEQDYQALVPLERRLRAGLTRVVRETLDKLEAETVGDLVVRVLVNEEEDTPPGRGEIVVAFVETADLAPDRDGEQTVRVARPIFPIPGTVGETGPQPTSQTTPADGPATHKTLPDPSTPGKPSSDKLPSEDHEAPEPIPPDGSVRLRWERGEAVIPPGVKRRVGRPSPKAPDRFVALAGASRRISSYQMAVENTGDAVVISRPVKANPVQVAGRLVQSGGKLRVSKLPVKISLSNGELMLRLERIGEPEGTP